MNISRQENNPNGNTTEKEMSLAIGHALGKYKQPGGEAHYRDKRGTNTMMPKKTRNQTHNVKKNDDKAGEPAISKKTIKATNHGINSLKPRCHQHDWEQIAKITILGFRRHIKQSQTPLKQI